MNKYLKLLLVPLFLFMFFAFTQNTYAAVKTWTGGGGSGNTNWSNGANWGGSAPTNGDSILFDTANFNSTADIALSLSSISISRAGTINGSSALTTNLVSVTLPANETVDVYAGIAGASPTINVTGGTLRLHSALGPNTSTSTSVTFSASTGTRLIFDGSILGNATSFITKNGNGELNIDSSLTLNNSSGKTFLNNGKTTCKYGNKCFGTGSVSLGNGSATTDVTLEFLNPQAASSFTNSIYVNPSGSFKNIIKSSVTDVDITLAGSLSADVNGSTKVYLDNGTVKNLLISGQITNSGGNLLSVEKIGTGKVVYTNASNTYSGATTITDGVLQLFGSVTENTSMTSTANGLLILANNSRTASFNGSSIYNGGKLSLGTYSNTVNGNLTLSKSYGIRFLSLNDHDYSSLFVNGTVNLTNTELVDWSESDLNIAPTIGQTFTIFSYTGARTGTFKNLPENSIFRIAGKYYFKVNYTEPQNESEGEVTLTSIAAPLTVHRFENKTNGYHHFTVDTGEIDFLKNSAYGQANWNYEGSKFQAFSTQVGNTLPVFRFFNFKNGQHFLTTDVGEKDFLQNSAYGQQNWQYEDIAFYMNTTLEGQMSPVSRFAHKVNGEHFYTIDAGEANFLRTSQYGQSTWADEGTSMYTFQ